MTKGILAADTHTGHALGLTAPEYQQGRCRGLQHLAFEWWANEIRQIGPVDFAIFDGDLLHGTGNGETLGLWTTDLEEQAQAASDALGIIRARERYICYGTPRHTVDSLNAENLIAKNLEAEIRETLRLKVQGPKWEVRFNARHVQGRSDTPYGQGTLTGKEVIREMVQAMIEDFRPADIVTRAHVHGYLRIDIAGRVGLSLPGMMIPDPEKGNYVYGRRARPWYLDVGFVYVEIDQYGEVFIRKRLAPLKVLAPKSYICLNVAGR